MLEFILTVGLNDKDAETQLISTSDAKKIIADTLINKYAIYAYTLTECEGVYKMQSTGVLVHEKSLKIEMVADAGDLTRETVLKIIEDLKVTLNQESIMIKESVVDVDFI